MHAFGIKKNVQNFIVLHEQGFEQKNILRIFLARKCQGTLRVVHRTGERVNTRDPMDFTMYPKIAVDASNKMIRISTSIDRMTLRVGMGREIGDKAKGVCSPEDRKAT